MRRESHNSGRLLPALPPPSPLPSIKPQKIGYPESEASSLWKVTPTPSVSNYSVVENDQERAKRILEARSHEYSALTPMEVNNIVVKKPKPKVLKKPLKFVRPGSFSNHTSVVSAREEETDGDTCFNDESFDTLSEQNSPGAERGGRSLAVTDTYGSQGSIHEWVEEQAQLTGKQLRRKKKPKLNSRINGEIETSSTDGEKRNSNLFSSETTLWSVETTSSSSPQRGGFEAPAIPPRIRSPSICSSSDTLKRRPPPPVPTVAEREEKRRRRKVQESASYQKIEVCLLYHTIIFLFLIMNIFFEKISI